MLRKALIIFLLLCPTLFAESPVVNLPLECRQPNWTNEAGDGSCVFATMVMAFRWQLKDTYADYIRNNYSGGTWADDSWNPGDNLARHFDEDGIAYAYTTSGDEAFLEWAVATRRGCGVTVRGGRHMILLVDLTATQAGLIDNNDISHVIWVDRNRFLSEWRASHGWAVTPLGDPAPPLPISGKDQ